MIVADMHNLGRAHGGRTIFAGLSWTIQEGEKIGLVGPNGVGKSTLLRTLAGLEAPDAGALTLRRGARVAYLPQEYAGEPQRSVMDELLAARADIAALEARVAVLEAQLGEPAVAGDMAALGRVLAEHERLLAQLEALGAATLRGRAEALLRALGLDEEHWDRPMGVLSGGQRKLVGLARCLLEGPDLLLLDEPDNHLDMERKALLEEVIRSFDGAVVIVSHDRYLLDETVGLVVELEPLGAGANTQGARLTRYEGNYSAYVTQKELALLRQQADYVAQQKEIARLEAAVARFKLWASMVVNERHIRQARNKQRQIDRMEKVERPVLERRRMALQFRPQLRGGAKAIELRGVDKAFGDTVVLVGASATIMNGERIGVVGPNGAGKSVLLRLILGQLPLDGGEVWIGPSIQAGSYAQQHETLDMAQTPIEALRALRPMYEAEAVAKLGRFLIPYAACSQPIARLSGGEKSRVQLARLMLSGANCLLLDEPTNNLDIPSAEVLERALEEFAGTVVVVSHDRYFLDRVADRIFEVRDGELRVYEGGYSSYAAQRAKALALPPPPPPAKQPAAKKGR
ncbi:MAG TPA: ABC-F family ATP-binding cassette domain-containing protein [Roseiflexaceae bacterium]|nr:ABC-F family ATP-binding cassette domain-containing protein [Roseiflexaceae bacterium]